MFYGCQVITLDAQHRMALPVRFRHAICQQSQNKPSQNNSLVVTKGIEGNKLFLTLYTLNKWAEIEEKVKALPSANPVSQQIRRLTIGSACVLDMDANYRILLPVTLRNYIGLHKKAVMLGVGEVMEIWDEQQWAVCEQDYQQNPVDFTALPEVFQNLNFY